MNIRLFLLMWLMLGALGFGKNIEVQSGDFAYFGAVVSSENVAGQEGKITLGAYDAYGNKTNYFGEKGRTFTLQATGSATLGKQTLTSADFESGNVTVSVSDRVAESSNITVHEGGNLVMVKNMATGTFVPGFSLRFDHAPLGSFDVSVPNVLVEGEEFSVMITAKDKVGNILADFSNLTEGVVVTAEGPNGRKNLFVPAHRFNEGRAEVSMRYDFGGEARIIVTDMNNQEAKGMTGPVTFEKQNLARIEVVAPEAIRAGVPFAVELKAINQFGRVMKSYSAIGDDLILQTNGRGELIPNKVPAKAFVNGTARFETLYTVPEPITITAVPAKTPSAKPEMAYNAPSKAAAAPAAVETPAPVAVETPAPAALQAPAPEQPKAEEAKPEETKAPVQEAAKQKNSFPLSFRFDAALGDIERIDSEYIPAGKLGVTRIFVRFDNPKNMKSVQPMMKDITVDGRAIGTLHVFGTFDKQGRMKVEIKENEPFSVDVKNNRESLDLVFLIGN